MTKEKIKNWIKETLNISGDFNVEYIENLAFGDLATNVAMILAKTQSKNPKELAEEYTEKLLKNKLPEIEKIEVAGPGFINFSLNKEFFAKNIETIISEKDNFGKNQSLAGQKFIVEYTDPNPFKEFHIGHLMSNSIGEAISRVAGFSGADIKRISYGGDVGLHVAKAVFEVLSQKEKISEIKNMSEKEQLSFWANCYVQGSSKYENDPEAKNKIDDLNKIIFDKTDEEINSLYDWGREVSIKHFQEIFKLLDTKFDRNFWESEVLEEAMIAVKEGLDKKVLEESEGAVVFKGEEYGLHTRVFVNSRGVPTYEAKELGLGVLKQKLFNFDKSIVITGNEQTDYFKVVLKAVELLRPEVANKTIHIGHGMLRFASGKMSSRKGNIITASSLISLVNDSVLEKMKDRDFTDSQKKEIAEQIAVGALKYSILKQTAGRDIIFDMDKSISFEGDSGPYLQYSAVRAKSILQKAGEIKIDSRIPEGWQTTNLEKILERFSSVVLRAREDYLPNYIATYLIELSGEFNSFYGSHKIIDEEDTTSSYKLSLVSGFLQVMTNGLYLLGIKVPERM